MGLTHLDAALDLLAMPPAGAILYHGTTGTLARQIAVDGVLRGSDKPSRAHQAPLQGRAYLSADIKEAVQYGYFRANHGGPRDAECGLVVVRDAALDQAVPDEDWLGERLVLAMERQRPTAYNSETMSVVPTTPEEQLESQARYWKDVKETSALFDQLWAQLPPDIRARFENHPDVGAAAPQSMLGKAVARWMLKTQPPILRELNEATSNVALPDLPVTEVYVWPAQGTSGTWIGNQPWVWIERNATPLPVGQALQAQAEPMTLWRGLRMVVIPEGQDYTDPEVLLNVVLSTQWGAEGAGRHWSRSREVAEQFTRFLAPTPTVSTELDPGYRGPRGTTVSLLLSALVPTDVKEGWAHATDRIPEEQAVVLDPGTPIQLTSIAWYDGTRWVTHEMTRAITAQVQELTLYHGTAASRFDAIQREGLTNPYLTKSYEVAEYYGEAQAEEDGTEIPIVLMVRVPDTANLRVDRPSFAEPLTFSMHDHDIWSEDEWHEALESGALRSPADENDWEASLETVGSVRYAGRIGPENIHESPESGARRSHWERTAQAGEPPPPVDDDVWAAERIMHEGEGVDIEEIDRRYVTIQELGYDEHEHGMLGWPLGALAAMTPEQRHAELAEARGEDWAQRAEQWIAAGTVPTIVVLQDASALQGQQYEVLDGYGRTRLAVGMGWQTVPAAIYRIVSSEEEDDREEEDDLELEGSASSEEEAYIRGQVTRYLGETPTGPRWKGVTSDEVYPSALLPNAGEPVESSQVSETIAQGLLAACTASNRPGCLRAYRSITVPEADLRLIHQPSQFRVDQIGDIPRPVSVQGPDQTIYPRLGLFWATVPEEALPYGAEDESSDSHQDRRAVTFVADVPLESLDWHRTVHNRSVVAWDELVLLQGAQVHIAGYLFDDFSIPGVAWDDSPPVFEPLDIMIRASRTAAADRDWAADAWSTPKDRSILQLEWPWLRRYLESVGFHESDSFDQLTQLVHENGYESDDDSWRNDPEAAAEAREGAWDSQARRWAEIQEELGELPSPMVPIYREISAGDIASVRVGKIGVYWSFDPDKAEAHWGRGGEPKYLVSAEVDEGSVDWLATVELNLDWNTGQDEAEIRLYPGARIFINSIYPAERHETMALTDDQGQEFDPPLQTTAQADPRWQPRAGREWITPSGEVLQVGTTHAEGAVQILQERHPDRYAAVTATGEQPEVACTDALFQLGYVRLSPDSLPQYLEFSVWRDRMSSRTKALIEEGILRTPGQYGIFIDLHTPGAWYAWTGTAEEFYDTSSADIAKNSTLNSYMGDEEDDDFASVAATEPAQAINTGWPDLDFYLNTAFAEAWERYFPTHVRNRPPQPFTYSDVGTVMHHPEPDFADWAYEEHRDLFGPRTEEGPRNWEPVAWRYAQEIAKDIVARRTPSDTIHVERYITVAGGNYEDIDFDRLGIHWTLDLESDAVSGTHGAAEETFGINAEVGLDDVDWVATLVTNWTHPTEHEITLHRGASIAVLSVDQNPWGLESADGQTSTVTVARGVEALASVEVAARHDLVRPELYSDLVEGPRQPAGLVHHGLRAGPARVDHNHGLRALRHCTVPLGPSPGAVRIPVGSDGVDRQTSSTSPGVRSRVYAARPTLDEGRDLEAALGHTAIDEADRAGVGETLPHVNQGLGIGEGVAGPGDHGAHVPKLYHGTSEEAWAQIQKEGRLTGPVYLSSFPELAERFAEYATAYLQAYVILEVRVPDPSKLRADLAMYENPEEGFDIEEGLTPPDERDWKTSLDEVLSVYYDGDIPLSFVGPMGQAKEGSIRIDTVPQLS